MAKSKSFAPQLVEVRHIETGEIAKLYPIDAQDRLNTGRWELLLEVEKQPTPGVVDPIAKLKESLKPAVDYDALKSLEAMLEALLETEGYGALKEKAEAVGFEKQKGMTWREVIPSLAEAISAVESQATA